MGEYEIERLLGFLQAHTALGLATDGGEAPWASILFYANDGPTLYFMTEPDKRLVANIASNPRVAATVVDEGDGLSTACGVQMVGRVAEVTTPAEAARGRALLLAKLARSGASALLGGADGLRALGRFAGARLYRMDIEHAWFTDNALGLGHRTKMEMKGGARVD